MNNEISEEETGEEEEEGEVPPPQIRIIPIPSCSKIKKYALILGGTVVTAGTIDLILGYMLKEYYINIGGMYELGALSKTILEHLVKFVQATAPYILNPQTNSTAGDLGKVEL